MKRLIRLFCLIAAATALGSCARDKVIPDEELARIFRDALIVSIIAILGIAALAAFNDGTYDMTMLYVGGVFALISAVAEFVAGIIGVINAKLPHKANTCIVWGVVVAVMCIAGEIISMIGGSQFNVFSLICGLAIPVLYIIGAVKNKA